METTDNLIDLDYTHNTCASKKLPTIWEIENNEKKQFIEYIDNIISTKFEKKILDQDKVIKQLTEENKKFKETINNLLFDFANCNVFNIYKFNELEKYHSNIIDTNREIEIEYIDYAFVSTELEKFYSQNNGNLNGVTKHFDKDLTGCKNFIKKLYINPNKISTINFKDKIFKLFGPHIFPTYFQNFIKTMNIRRETFQYDRNSNFRLMIFINDTESEKNIINAHPNIQFSFIPNIQFIGCRGY